MEGGHGSFVAHQWLKQQQKRQVYTDAPSPLTSLEGLPGSPGTKGEGDRCSLVQGQQRNQPSFCSGLYLSLPSPTVGVRQLSSALCGPCSVCSPSPRQQHSARPSALKQADGLITGVRTLVLLIRVKDAVTWPPVSFTAGQAGSLACS